MKKNPMKIGWKIKISNLLQNHIFEPFDPFYTKIWKSYKKMLGGPFVAFFMRFHLENKIKIFPYYTKLNIAPHSFDPF